MDLFPVPMDSFPAPMGILRAAVLMVLACGLSAAKHTSYYPAQDNANNEPEVLDVLMPGVIPTEIDQYICASQPVKGELYIVNFIPRASMKTVHHMLLYGCADVSRNQLEGRYSRNCGSTCIGASSILFAWARDAPPPQIPADVGFHIGGSSGINYLTLQIHYGNITPFQDGRSRDTSGLSLSVTRKEPDYLGGILLNMGMQIEILPNVQNTHTDIACEYKEATPIHAFAFRTHAHGLGKVISGYRIRNDQWELIAKGNPQWPQAFYPMSEIYEIRYSDIIATRCTFDGTKTDHTVHVGGAHTDEMCNLYIMYYTDADGGKGYQSCAQPGTKNLFSHIPPGSDTPPAEMPWMGTSPKEDQGDAVEDAQETLDSKVDQVQDTDLLGQAGSRDEATTAQADGGKEEEDAGSRVLNEVQGWASDLTLGQVGGVHMDTDDNLVLFHRASTIWDAESFDDSNHYVKADAGPINQNVVLTLDNTGKEIDHWGANLFLMPHGLFVDHDDNIWVTDVALHQVFKFDPRRSKTAPLLTLGSRLKPGSDQVHFCKPADVAVDPLHGSFYVADGYCNSRIMKFSPEGQIQLIIDESAIQHLSPKTMLIVHSVTLAHNYEHVCAADRENGRVLCFDAHTGNFLRQIMLPEFGGRVFAVQYSPKRGGVLFVINGESFLNKPVMGVTVNYTTGTLLETWTPAKSSFMMPHDVTVSSNANEVYVGETGPNKVWKFVDSVPVKTPEKIQHLQENLERDSLLSHDAGDVSVPMGKAGKGEDPKDFGTTAVILTVLAVPILLMMVIAVVVRLQAQGRLRTGRGMFVVRRGQKRGDTFSIGNFFNKKKGFSQVSTDDSDEPEEGTTWSEESDVEEYSILNSKRTQNL